MESVPRYATRAIKTHDINLTTTVGISTGWTLDTNNN